MGASLKSYLFANTGFALIIILVIGYSLVFRGHNHPVPSILTQVTGELSPSKGLSASFSEIVRGNLAEAYSANPHGLRVFSFFALQLLLRVAVSIMVLRLNIGSRAFLLADSLVSLGLFLWCFAPFISYTLSRFYQGFV